MKKNILTLFLWVLFLGNNSICFCRGDADKIDYSQISQLHWVGPGHPCSYEEYMMNCIAEPLHINTYPQAQRVLNGQLLRDRKVLIVVNANLSSQIETRLLRYVADIETQGYLTELYTSSGGVAADLKNFIIAHSSNLIGCIFVGDIPIAWYEVSNDYGTDGYKDFPCDLYYMDLDGVWVDSDSNGKYDDQFAGTGDEGPEIFVSRISASSMDGNESDLINAYFDKDHDYWCNSISLSHYALAYTDDDWRYSPEFSYISDLYPNYQCIRKPYTERTDYVDARLHAPYYEFIQLACHSNSYCHKFTRGGYTYSSDIKSAMPQAIFYNLFCCSSCRYVDSNYMGGAYLFNASNRSLAVIGSTKTGSMLYFSAFYVPLAQEQCLGDSFRAWFDILAPYSDNEIFWHFGMCLLGDPLLTITRNDQLPAVEISLPEMRSSIIQYNQFCNSTMMTECTADLLGIWGVSSQNVFAVGDSGTILHYNGVAWDEQISGVMNNLNSVWGSSSQAVFAIGTYGNILRYNGSLWSSMSSGIINTLYAIWGSSAQNIFAVGSSGMILRFNGSSWRTMTSGTNQSLYAVWGISANNVFAAGASGTILHYNGSTWINMTSNTGNSLYALWGSSSNDIFAAGSSGTICHYNGTNWRLMSSMVKNTESIEGIWGYSQNAVFAVDTSGAVHFFNGNFWELQDQTPVANLRGIWGSSVNELFIVGDLAMITLVNEKISIHGSAHAGSGSGSTFDYYTLEWGAGSLPSSWFQIGSPSHNSVIDGLLLESWDTTTAAEGLVTIRLTASDNTGALSRDFALVTVDNIYIHNPKPRLFVSSSNSVEIGGTASCTNLQEYRLEYGRGKEPTTWHLITQSSVACKNGILGEWDTSLITDPDYYTLRLTVTSDDLLSNTDEQCIVLDPFIMDNWPKAINFQAGGESIATGDIDANGDMELIVAEMRYGYSGQKMYAWHHDGSPVLGWPIDLIGDWHSAPALADIDNDWNLEIFVSCGNSKCVMGFHHNGSPIFGWPQMVTNQILASPTIIDIDLDGVPEILAGTYGSASNVFCWNTSGQVRDGWPVTANGDVHASLAVGNIVGDEALEVVAAASDLKLYAWSADGILLDGWPVIYVGYVAGTSAPVLADIDEDSYAEVFYYIYPKANAWEGNGNPVPGWPRSVSSGSSSGSEISIGDIDADTDLEIVIGGKSALHHGGSFVYGWPIWDDTSENCTVIGNLDSDEEMELISAGPESSDKVYAFNHDGSMLNGWPRYKLKYVKLSINDTTRYKGTQSPVLCDFDGDGKIEIIQAAEEQVVVWDTEADFTTETIEWSMFQHNVRRTGLYNQAPPPPPPPPTPTMNSFGVLLAVILFSALFFYKSVHGI